MKRLRVILLFLLLGAVVNVGVAWGCAAWIFIPATNIQTAWLSLPGLRNTEGWFFSRKDAFGATHLVAWARDSRIDKIGRIEELLPAWSDMKSKMDEAAEEARRETNKPENVNVNRRIDPPTFSQKAYGFPFRSMYWNWNSGIRNMNSVSQDPISNGIMLKPHPFYFHGFSLDHERALPLDVIPFGFAINTIFYASLFWLLIPGPFVFRRMIRHNRGLCLKCAYDLRGAEHEACPECGEQVAHPSPN